MGHIASSTMFALGVETFTREFLMNFQLKNQLLVILSGFFLIVMNMKRKNRGLPCSSDSQQLCLKPLNV